MNKVEGEIFRDIPGFAGYQVSNHGRVRNFARDTIMSLCYRGETRYVSINLRKGGRRHTRYVHRLVMLAFVGEPPEGYSVDHIDRIPSNNFLENLRYATQSEQNANQTKPQDYKGRSVQKIGDCGATFSSVKAAAMELKSEADPLQEFSLMYFVNGIHKAVKSGRTWKGHTWQWIEDDQDSKWRRIPAHLIDGTKGSSASENGEIKMMSGRVTKGCKRPDGYRYVCIAGRSFSVHRLVAGTFLPSATNENAILVNHLNGIKDDNRVNNLQFVTHSENTQHAVDTGLLRHVGRSVAKYTLAGEYIAEFKSIADAAKTVSGGGGSFKNVSSCCRGVRKSAYGFIWRYSISDSNPALDTSGVQIDIKENGASRE